MPKDSRPAPIQFRPGSIEDAIEARKKSMDSSTNVTAKRDLERYYELLDEVRPHFTRAQALYLCDLLNGTLFQPVMQAARLLWAEVQDAPPTLAEKHDVDQDALVQRLNDLSLAESLAVVDAVERFWNGTDEGVTVTDVGLCGPPEKRN